MNHIGWGADRATSMRVKGGPWVIYADDDYSGHSHVIYHGDYPNASFFGLVGDDQLHSIQLLPATGICLFPEENYNGEFVHVEEGQQNLDVSAKSVIVRSGEWDVFLETSPNADADSAATVPVGNHPHNPKEIHTKEIKAVRPSKVKGNIEIYSETDEAEVSNNSSIKRLGDSPAIEILIDSSSSMKGTKIETAKTVLKDLIVNDIPEGSKVALRVFGVGRCNESKLIYPLQDFDEAKLLKVVDEIRAIRTTPIAATIAKVKGDLENAKGDRLVILMTDGAESCNPDKDAAHAEILKLRDHGFDVVVNIVGFDINSQSLKNRFDRWAVAGGGEYYDARDASQLGKQMKRALSVPYVVRRNDDMEAVASGYVDGEAVELDAGIDYRIEYVLPGTHTYQKGIIRVEGGKTTRIPVYRGK